MKTFAVALALFLIGAVSVPASAAPAPLTFELINSTSSLIVLFTNGGCGGRRFDIRAGQRVSATCAVGDGLSSLTVKSFPWAKILCEAHVTRQGGIDSTKIDKSSQCRERQSLNHIEMEIVTAPRPAAR